MMVSQTKVASGPDAGGGAVVGVIEAFHLTKQHRVITAVDDVSFTAPDGNVTGFVGPNGSGNSSTMRMVVGLDRSRCSA
ncbi:ATP-binding cassette domain-containing protein [Streptomyces bathyalis]|uniref:ATP-binding cassette domain-containing protein n=1 Tax=Streptomyces bathyalis TaxID=2710756 RepID=A0A7T1T7Y2_9ACTN|nr:ATP-binding cassette domain-containing protein [Streptomyces bathyalis]